MKRISSESSGAVLLSFGLSLFFLYLELLKAHRSSQWAGILPGDWVGIALAVALYSAAIGGLLTFWRWGGKRLGKTAPAWDGLLLPLAGGIVWALLSVHREFTPTADDAIVAAVLLGAGLALALGARRQWWNPRSFAILLIGCWLAGIAALAAAGEYFLYAPDRARAVTIYPILWLAAAGAVLLCVARIGRGRALLPTGLVFAVAPLVFVAWMLRPPAEESASDRPPNLVLFIADTLRADYCSVYGGQVPTPNLEQLAARGARFDRHYALAPWTLPSMTGLFASQYPKSLAPDAGHEAWTLQMNQYEVDYTQPTFPMLLEEAGYATAAFTANAFLPVIPGMMFGYQDRASSHPILLEDEGLFRQLPFLGALARAWCPPLANIRPHNTTRDLDHYAAAFIERHRNQPFFLWIHYIDPHAPYDPPESMRRVQDGPWPFFHPYVGGEEWGVPVLGKNFEVDPAHRDYVQSLYEGEVAYIDAYAGRIMEVLADAGVAEDTYFCFTSDHGEELWDHGGWGHGQSLYDEQVRVPLIVAGPDVPRHVESAPLSAIDLVPTLADLAGVSPAPAWRGESFAPALRGGASLPADRPIFAGGTSNKAPNPQHMVVQGDYKLIRTAGSDTPELYDLKSDPEETNNIAEAHPGRVRALHALLDEWLGSFVPFFDLREGDSPEFNRELEQGLEGMGYL